MRLFMIIALLWATPTWAITCQEFWDGIGPASEINANLACLSWAIPTQYVDGAPLPPDQIAGYKIYYGKILGSLTDTVEINGFDSSGYQLPIPCVTSEYHFKITAIGINGEESQRSQPVSKIFTCNNRPNPPEQFRVEMRIVTP